MDAGTEETLEVNSHDHHCPLHIVSTTGEKCIPEIEDEKTERCICDILRAKDTIYTTGHLDERKTRITRAFNNGIRRDYPIAGQGAKPIVLQAIVHSLIRLSILSALLNGAVDADEIPIYRKPAPPALAKILSNQEQEILEDGKKQSLYNFNVSVKTYVESLTEDELLDRMEEAFTLPQLPYGLRKQMVRFQSVLNTIGLCSLESDERYRLVLDRYRLGDEYDCLVVILGASHWAKKDKRLDAEILRRLNAHADMLKPHFTALMDILERARTWEFVLVEKEKPFLPGKLDKARLSKIRRAVPSLSYLYGFCRFIPPIRRFPALKDTSPFVANMLVQYIYTQDRWLKEMRALWSSKQRDTLALELPTTDFKTRLLILLCFHLSTTVTGVAMVPGGFEARGLAAGLVTVGLGIQMVILGYWWYWTEHFRLAVVAMVLFALLRVLTVVGIEIALLYAIIHEKGEDSEKED